MTNANSVEESNRLFFRKIYHKLGKTIHDFQLIQEGDTIVVGLSGGKDSLALLDLLSGRMKYSGIRFYLVAIHVNITSIPYEVDVNYLQEFCDSRRIPFYLINRELNELEVNKKNPCFICSWNRRKILYEETQKLGYSKLALGHHKDDAVETLLMNMTFQGNISSMLPKLNLFNDKFQIIRPLITLSNDEMDEYSNRKGFIREIKKCPFESDSKRHEIRKILQLLKQMNPEALNNIFASMGNIQTEYLP